MEYLKLLRQDLCLKDRFNRKKIGGEAMINGISSMQLFDTKRKSVITENSYSKIKPLNMEFRVQVSLEDKKIHDKLIDMLASSSVELVNVLNKLFCHGGCIHFCKKRILNILVLQKHRRIHQI